MAIQFEHYVTDSMLDLSQATQGLQNGELTSEDLKMLQLFLQRNLGRVLNLKPLIEQIYRFVNSFCSSLHQPLISI